MIIDLSKRIENGMFVFPGNKEVLIEDIEILEKDGWNMKRLHINSHDGTHVNTPIHCIKNGKTLDNYSIEDFYGETYLYEKIETIKPNYGIIFSQQITVQIMKDIICKKPKFVGLTAEVDVEIEKELLKNKIILFEQLSNTNQLPEKFIFYGIPLKIKEGDGSPVRAFAITEESKY